MHFSEFQLTPSAKISPDRLHEYHNRNDSHLKPWSPFREHSLRTCERHLSNLKAAEQNGTAVSFALINGGNIIGLMNFSAITGFPFQACYLGFSIDAAHEGKGLAKLMLVQAIERVFRAHSLNRIMANFMSKNQRSGRLLFRLGFQL